MSIANIWKLIEVVITEETDLLHLREVAMVLLYTSEKAIKNPLMQSEWPQASGKLSGQHIKMSRQSSAAPVQLFLSSYGAFLFESVLDIDEGSDCMSWICNMQRVEDEGCGHLEHRLGGDGGTVAEV